MENISKGPTFGDFFTILTEGPVQDNTVATMEELFQGIATMTYTRSHPRPSQKDLGCVVYPLNNKSLVATCKTTEYKSTDSPLSPLLNVMYCERFSLRTVKIFLAQH